MLELMVLYDVRKGRMNNILPYVFCVFILYWLLYPQFAAECEQVERIRIRPTVELCSQWVMLCVWFRIESNYNARCRVLEE